jgi:hypothetical protein
MSRAILWLGCAIIIAGCGVQQDDIANSEHGLSANVERWRELVEKYFKSRHVNWALNIIKCESNGDPNAKNKSSGASGLFQHLPRYWAERARKAGFGGKSAFHPEANIAASAYLLYAKGGGKQHWECKYSPFEQPGYTPRFFDDNGNPVGGGTTPPNGTTPPPTGGWGTCNVSGQPGVCQDTATPCYGGTYHANHCPGPSNIRCCVGSSYTPPPPPTTTPPPSAYYQPELCNNFDDNGNGMVDEGNPGGGQPCATGMLGECARGVQMCINGRLTCQPMIPPTMEVCDGKDNDCNGQVDDSLSCTGGYPGGPGGGVGCYGARTELCNGYDDDCDGRIDNGNPGGGAFCVTGMLGECRRGQSVCQNGRITCVAVTSPTQEICDGLDNDCNGKVDDSPSCNGAGQNCNPSAPEICNGKDDNCNGQVDEGNPGGGQTCFAAGSCPVGVTVCQGGVLRCQARQQPETCDGLDNDCNGQVDDVVGGCQNSRCVPSPEICNGKDDDCDGFPDENNPGGGAPCLVSNRVPGMLMCINGKHVCMPRGNASIEGVSGCSLDPKAATPGHLFWPIVMLIALRIRRPARG